jgi:hypothetical protein
MKLQRAEPANSSHWLVVAWVDAEILKSTRRDVSAMSTLHRPNLAMAEEDTIKRCQGLDGSPACKGLL